MPMTDQQFAKEMPSVDGAHAIAVAVSGGPDSMALCWLLSRWGAARNVEIHAITVDHGLRAEAATEAKDVGTSIKDWPNTHHATLRWEGDKPGTRILEEARAARYGLIRTYMQSHGIRHLFTAHHQDDQAETFLIRLAKGSGLDGLSSMNRIHSFGPDMLICRPLLDVSKADLIALCQSEGIPFANDPTNENEKYLRPRLRAARDVLEEEGMTAKRLAVTAQRIARARRALEELSGDLYDRALKTKTDGKFLFDWAALKNAPEELSLRVLLRAVQDIYPGEDYGPRLEKMEQLLTRLLHETGFKSATLAGCLFALHPKDGTLGIEKEKS